MDYNSSSNDLFDLKPICQGGRKRSAVAGKQGWKITGMGRVRFILRIKVAPGIGKTLSLAVAALVDMKSKDACFTFRKAADIRDNQNTA